MCSDKPAPLAGAEQIAQAVLGVDQLGEHDVAEGHAEQRSKTLIYVGQRQRDQDLADDLPLGSAQSGGRFDVAVRHRGDRAHRVGINERNAGDEDEHHLLRFVDAEPQNRQRDQRGNRDISRKQRDRHGRRFQHAPGTSDDPQRHAHHDRQPESDENAPERRHDARGQGSFVPQCVEASGDLERRRQNHGRNQPLFRRGTARRQEPRGQDERNGTRPQKPPHERRRGNSEIEKARLFGVHV